mgnify:CR=1 FL=1
MFAAENIFRMRWLSVLVQSWFTFLRAVPTPVWVLLMMVCLGMGPGRRYCRFVRAYNGVFYPCFCAELWKHPAGNYRSAGGNRRWQNRRILQRRAACGTFAAGSVDCHALWNKLFGMLPFWAWLARGGIGFIIARSIQGYEYGTAGVAIVLVFAFAYSIERLFIFIKNKIRWIALILNPRAGPAGNFFVCSKILRRADMV